MAQNITYYENLIREKRKKTPFREFVRDLGSWDTLNLYKRDGKVCRFPDTERVKKLGNGFWEEASSIQYDYNNSQDLFGNVSHLQSNIPMQYTLQFGTNENSDYGEAVFTSKNVYLSFIAGFSAENILYSAFCYTNVKSVMNSFLVCKDVSEVANSIGVTESYKVFYSKNIANSSDIYFSTNLIGCHYCIGCDNLDNVSYAINNKKLEKEEYEKQSREILRDKKQYDTIWNHIHKRPITNFASENCTGRGVVKSSNIENGLWTSHMHTGRNIAIGNGNKGCTNVYDGMDIGIDIDHYYAVMAAGGAGTHDVYCSMQILDSSNCYYSLYLSSCHHCFGCIGLKNKSYCILNKQYTKEEWEVKVCEIFESMEKDGSLGNFFPASMNPFYFNDTLAYLIDDSFTREEVTELGYLWRDEPIRADIPEGVRVVLNSELDQFEGFRARHPEGNEGSRNMDSAQAQNDGTIGTTEWYIDPEVMKVVISDEKGNYYRIVKMEYDFLMRHGLPLPRMHWLDRMKAGFQSN